MVTGAERKFVMAMVWLRLWKARIGMFRTIEVIPRKGTRWLFNWLRRRQVVDDLHHAPGCAANHWHKMRLVFSACNCGAAAEAERTPTHPGKGE